MAASERRVFFRRDKVEARDGKYDEYGSERSKSAISSEPLSRAVTFVHYTPLCSYDGSKRTPQKITTDCCSPPKVENLSAFPLFSVRIRNRHSSFVLVDAFWVFWFVGPSFCQETRRIHIDRLRFFSFGSPCSDVVGGAMRTQSKLRSVFSVFGGRNHVTRYDGS